MPNTTNNFQKMLDLLREGGSNDDQIAEFLAHLSNQVSEDLYVKAFEAFTDEDVEAIKNAKLPQEIDYEIRTRYFNRTGNDPDQEAQAVYQEFAKKFIENYNNKNNSQKSNSNSNSSDSKQPHRDPHAGIFSALGSSSQSHGSL